MTTHQELQFKVEGAGQVSALLTLISGPRHLLVLAHGAGAGMRHPFMEDIAHQLAPLGVATLRYQFPYMEKGRRIPDAPAVLTTTVVSAIRTASQLVPGIPLLAGGKSMGGRMTSRAAADHLPENVIGLVFFGFPLHPPNRPGSKRADHLAQVTVPMLFLQGTRDTFAGLDLLRPVCATLGPRATLHTIDNADHSFHVPKRSGRNDADVFCELAKTTASWAAAIATSHS
jgi:predicted alpha/beta-hydrolase family hydrolase